MHEDRLRSPSAGQPQLSRGLLSTKEPAASRPSDVERSQRTDDGLSPASAQRKRPTVVAAPLKQIARASREGARGESTKRCGQRAAPEHTSGSNRRSCAFKQSATPSVEIAAALASTMARRSLKVVAAVGPSPAFASVTSRVLVLSGGLLGVEPAPTPRVPAIGEGLLELLRIVDRPQRRLQEGLPAVMAQTRQRFVPSMIPTTVSTRMLNSRV